MKFIDEVVINIGSGKGGSGCLSFRRETFAPRGGPDGGDGGRGGDLIVRANHHMNSLIEYRPNKHYFAKNGQPGQGALMSGKDGEDLILEVPEGTVIKDEEGVILADVGPGQEITLLQGGRGGKGNAHFKNSVNQAPAHFQPGEEGQQLRVKLELKLIADVGLLGFPSVGKSTLISKLSAAKPKIADYPFTTLAPNLGVVKIDDDFSFVIADVPGLIEGAHEGAGLGIKFLKHIERTRAFVHLLDPSEFSGRDPIDDYQAIRNELIKYDESQKEKEGYVLLQTRPEIVALNKADLLSEGQLSQLQSQLHKIYGVSSMVISAATGQGLPELKKALANLVLAGKKTRVEG